MKRERNSVPALVLLLSSACVSIARGDDSLRDTIGDKPLAGHWIYNDLPKAEAVARGLKKPLLVVFRCVPCQCAQQLDADLTDPAHPINEVLKKYVCVRIVHMAGVDLARFQFDWDVSLVALMVGPDGTIYGRYGTRAVRTRTENTHVSTASFQKALERALAIHAEFPKNLAALAGKQPRKVPLARPEDSPELAKLGEQAISRKNCIHCHMAGEALVHHAAKSGKLTAAQLWPFPLPDNVGLVIDKEDGLALKSVRKESPANRAGLVAGDVLRSLDGQPLVSQADIQWVLHHAPQETELKLTFERGGETLERKLVLSGNWRTTDTTWRPSLNPLRGGLHLALLSGGERMQYGLQPAVPAFMVRYAFRAAGKAGLRAGDVVLTVDGQPMPASESELLAYCRLSEPRRKSIELRITSKNHDQKTVTLPLGIELVPE
ncbi:MAG: PDZ domain-containing protein [Planctomycetaceae bacterium]|nr:PDZ domain-containing protein [Planctomycetaceae bacterium]